MQEVTLSTARINNLPLEGKVPKAVFFDRDGTLNVDIHYLHRPEDFVWIEGAKEAIKYVNDKDYLAILVTNQSGVARGYYPEQDWSASRCALLLPASPTGEYSPVYEKLQLSETGNGYGGRSLPAVPD